MIHTDISSNENIAIQSARTALANRYGHRAFRSFCLRGQPREWGLDLGVALGMLGSLATVVMGLVQIGGA